MTNYNPSAPETIGLEWAPTAARSVSVGSTPATAAVIDSTLAESIDRVSAYLRPMISGTGRVVCDVYDASDLASAPPWPSALANGSVVAGADGVVTPGWQTERGGTSHFGPSLDTCRPASRPRSYVQLRVTGAVDHVLRVHGGVINGQDCTGTIPGFVGQRIASVAIRAYLINKTTRVQQAIGELALPDDMSGALATYSGTSQSLPPNASVAAPYYWTYTLNPATNEPWTLGELADLLSGGGGEFGVRIKGSMGAADNVGMTALAVVVTYCPETRVATSRATVSAAGWQTFILTDPATSDPISWGKRLGRRYWLAFHQPSGALPIQWSTLDGADLPGLGSTTLAVQTNGSGVLDPNGSWPPVVTQAVPAVVLSSGALPSLDSSPYATITAGVVAFGQPLIQELTDLSTSADYGVVLAYVRAPSAALPDATLDIDVIDRTAGDVVVAGPYRLPVSALIPDPGGYARVLAQLPASFTPVGAHRYAIRCTSTTDPSAPWWVATLDALASTWASAGYGGAGIGVVRTSGRVDAQDALLALSEPPEAITGLQGRLYQQPLGQTGLGACAIPYAYGVRLAWTQSSVPTGKFAYYEIQRTDDADGWQTIGRTADIATSTFYDFEGRRNALATYRVRQVRADGAVGPWSGIVTAQPPSATTDLLIVSNVAPSVNVAYNFEPDDQSFVLLDAEEVIYRKLQGRNYQVEYRPLETRGDRFTRTITIAFADATAPVGRSVFYPVEQLQRARVPMLTVLDGEGHRWYAGVVIGNVRRDEPGGRYEAEIQVTELSDVPAAPTAAWGPGGTPSGDTYGDPGGTYADAPGGTYAT